MAKTIADTIINRRTSKTSLPTEVPAELIFDLLAQASYAPFHKKEPWHAKIITTEAEKKVLYERVIATLERNHSIHDDKSREKLTMKMTRLIKNSPATIIFARELIPDNPRLDSDSIQATAALIQNFSLLAWEKNLVGFWASSGFILDAQLAKELGFPDNYEIIANYRLGYRDLERKPINAKREPIENWATSLL